MLDFISCLNQMESADTMRMIRTEAKGDPAKANELIRDGFYRLSVALGRFLHGDVEDPENANFATFATWSAQSLRPDVTDDKSERLPRRRARWLYDQMAHRVLTDPLAVARNIALGQAAIYEETGPAIHALLQVTTPAVRAAQDEIANAVVAGVKTPEPEPDWDEVWKLVCARLITHSDELNRVANQQRLSPPDVAVLQDALAPYFEVLRRRLTTATDDDDRKKRAELILLGNLRLVAYEQRRLQPVLERNLGIVPQALRLRLVNRWLGRPTLLTNAVMKAYPRISPHLGVVEEAFQIAATRYLFLITVGGEPLRLGADLPLPPPAHPLVSRDQPLADRERYAVEYFFPYHLQVLERSDLWAEWQKHDRSAGQGVRTAVDDWLRYPERMNFIANLFRSRQQLAAMYSWPASTPEPDVLPIPLGGDSFRSVEPVDAS